MINKCPDLRKVIFYFYKAFLSRIAKPTGFKNNEVKMKKNIIKSDSYLFSVPKHFGFCYTFIWIY